MLGDWLVFLGFLLSLVTTASWLRRSGEEQADCEGHFWVMTLAFLAMFFGAILK